MKPQLYSNQMNTSYQHTPSMSFPRQNPAPHEGDTPPLGPVQPLDSSGLDPNIMRRDRFYIHVRFISSVFGKMSKNVHGWMRFWIFWAAVFRVTLTVWAHFSSKRDLSSARRLSRRTRRASRRYRAAQLFCARRSNTGPSRNSYRS